MTMVKAGFWAVLAITLAVVQSKNVCTGQLRFNDEGFSQISQKTANAMSKVAKTLCKYASSKTPFALQFSEKRWTASVEKSMQSSREALQKILESAPKDKLEPWKYWRGWMADLIMKSDAHAISALKAPVSEFLWKQQLRTSWALGNLKLQTQIAMPDLVIGALQEWKRAGLVQESQRFFNEVLDIKVGQGAYPYRYLYDTLDVWRNTPCPIPGLRKLVWPSVSEIFPAGIAESLKSSWQQIATEARKLMKPLAKEPDAYPGITGGQQWTKLMLYLGVGGWNEGFCKVMKTVCKLLKGRMRSETDLKTWFDKRLLEETDEVVGLFRVKGPGAAYLHSGQDVRVNVHLCLVNCNSSRLWVAGDERPYYDGSLFAFEDRADHEILNGGSEDRINLVIGTLHPDLDPVNNYAHTPITARLQFVISNLEKAVPDKLTPQALGEALMCATYIGHLDKVKLLLTHGAPVDFAGEESFGSTATHTAIGQNWPEVLEVLLAHGANAELPMSNGMRPAELAAHVAAAGKGSEKIKIVQVVMRHHATNQVKSDVEKILKQMKRQDLLQHLAERSDL